MNANLYFMTILSNVINLRKSAPYAFVKRLLILTIESIPGFQRDNIPLAGV